MATYLDGPFGTPAQQGAKQISFPLQNQKDYSAKEIVREMMQYPSTGYYPIIQNQVSATNSLKWSDDLTQVGNWSDGSLVAILANATTDPQGGISASAIQEISGSGVHYMAQSGATLAGVGPTGFGVFLKANGRTFARLLGSTTADGTLCTTMFNLALGTVVSTTSGQASIKSVGNGWFWCTVSGTSTSVAGLYFQILLSPDGSTVSYAGSPGLGIYACCATCSSGISSGFPAIQTTSVTRSVVCPPVDVDPDGNVFDPLAFLTAETSPNTSQLAKGIADWVRTYDRIPIEQVVPSSYAFTAPSYQSLNAAAQPVPSSSAVGNYGYIQGVTTDLSQLINGYYDQAVTIGNLTLQGTYAGANAYPVSFTVTGTPFVVGDIVVLSGATGNCFLGGVINVSAGTVQVCCITANSVAAYIVGPLQARRLTINKTDQGQVVGLRAQIIQDYYLPGFTAGVNYFTDIPAISPYSNQGYLAAYATPATSGSQTFTASGTFTVPAGVRNVSAYVIGGGGGGGTNSAGGGGGGGILSVQSFAVMPGQTIAVGVGAGGAGSTSGAALGSNGSNSTFGPYTAVGGGGGGSGNLNSPGASGGSGGGGAGAAMATIGGAGMLGQGNAGGSVGFASWGGGGGGGFTAAGANVGNPNGGAGAAGLVIGGTTYGSGGGGGGFLVGSGAAGGSGAGAGGNPGAVGNAATANTGGGGGGGGWGQNGGNGGSGIVLITWSYQGWFNVLSDGLKYWKGAILQRAYTQALLSDVRPVSTYVKYTGTTTFTVPAGITQIRRAIIVGGGGGGGYGVGNGGGGGGVLCYDNVPVTPGDVWTITIGAGGAGSTAAGSAGTVGTQSSVTLASGAVWQAGGGGGGGSNNGATIGSAGGAGALAAGSPINTGSTPGTGGGGGGGSGTALVLGGAGCATGGNTGAAATGLSGYTAGGGGSSGTGTLGGLSTLFGNGGGGAAVASGVGGSGAANSGAGGGGGGAASNGGQGGSGVIILCY